MKVKIKVPATSGNVGPGFDCLGLALTLYNEFHFEPSDKVEFIGFTEEFSNVENNLVVQSMKKTYDRAKLIMPSFKISIVQNVPISRGLGSSSTCIVAGVMAANYFLNNKYTKNEVLDIATEIEGHPDNVAPAIFGSLVASYVDKEVRFIKYPVSDELIFTVAIPNFKLSTKEARGVLPKTLSYGDVIHTMSRAINIPYALSNGNLSMLFELLDDKIHQPYRFPLIHESNKFKDYTKAKNIPFSISGSGSTLLFISKEDLTNKLKELNLEYQWKLLSLKADKFGAVIETL